MDFKKATTSAIIGLTVIAGAVAMSQPDPAIEKDKAVKAPTEITTKRTYDSKTFENPDGSFTLKQSLGHIHYKSETGELLDSDISFKEVGNSWEMTTHNYHLNVKKQFMSNRLITYTSLYDGANHTIHYTPIGLGWTTVSNLSDYLSLKQVSIVDGVLNGEKNRITYPNAYGEGIDFEITLHRSGFTKEVVIRDKTALGQFPKDSDLVAYFEFESKNLRDIKRISDSTSWDKSSLKSSKYGFTFEDASSTQNSFLLPAYIMDNSTPPERENVDVFWLEKNRKIIQGKVLPTSFLDSATYPVRADTTTDYYAGSGDGYVKNDNSTSWSTVHDASTGNSAATSGDGVYVGQYSGSRYRIYRTFFPIDTSALPDDATISAASFFLYILATSNADNDGNDYLAVVQTTQASTASLATSDYGSVGATEGSNKYDISSISSTAYLEMVLNATGRGWINLTGYTKIGVREGHDILNDVIVPSGGSYNHADLHFSENANPPYLEVTYTVGGGGGYSGQPVILFE